MMFPTTVPVRGNPSSLAEMEQLTDPWADPFVTGGCGTPLNVKVLPVGTKMPVPPPENVKCAAFNVGT
jgi:hypothetical protein